MKTQQTLYDQTNDRLVVLKEKATVQYWHNLWAAQADNIYNFVKSKKNYILIRYARKYLSPGSKVLDAGCGLADKVFTLQKRGYEAYGVDFAKDIVGLVNRHFPELKVFYSDVQDLRFPDNNLDAYFSFGVIEHFFDGYGKVIEETSRVLKKGGYLFLAFPYISILRKIKIKLKKYKDVGANEGEESLFYQFILDHRKVAGHLEAKGFRLIEGVPYDAAKGWKDEVRLLNKPLAFLYNSDKVFFKVIKYLLDRLSSWFAGHSIMLIFKKDG